MKITTEVNGHLSQIKVDGQRIPVWIEKGENPKFGMHREWHVYYEAGGSFGPAMTVYRRKSDAVEAVRILLEVGAQIAQRNGA